jgi:hypothetical protein
VSFTCPRCLMTSYHPEDERHGYCGHCHDFTGTLVIEGTITGRFANDAPAFVEVCRNCERCTWNPGPDCGRADHPHCEACGHCLGRHA